MKLGFLGLGSCSLGPLDRGRVPPPGSAEGRVPLPGSRPVEGRKKKRALNPKNNSLGGHGVGNNASLVCATGVKGAKHPTEKAPNTEHTQH